jgi:hypothetical protein
VLICLNEQFKNYTIYKIKKAVFFQPVEILHPSIMLKKHGVSLPIHNQDDCVTITGKRFYPTSLLRHGLLPKGKLFKTALCSSNKIIFFQALDLNRQLYRLYLQSPLRGEPVRL